MKIQIRRRAEIALRSLHAAEQVRLYRALHELSVMDRALLGKRRKLQKLPLGDSDTHLFMYRSAGKLRLILSFADDLCIVEDVINHDRFKRMITRGEQA